MEPTRWGVLVGTDGSEASMHALDWAAREIAGTDAHVTVCYVADAPVVIDVPLPSDVREDASRYGRRVVDRALERIAGIAPSARTEGHVVAGNPAAELLRMAADAEQVVVGNRGAGGFEQLMLGSVGAQVAAHAPCPVTVVRAEGTGDTVLVGVDGSEPGERALEHAFAYAARHGLGVLAMHAVPAMVLVPPVPLSAWVPVEEISRHAEIVLADAVTRWSPKFPGVPVETKVVQGAAAKVLADASHGSALLVVGSRGHGGFGGLLLGSVSQAVIRHAACPVAISR